MEAPDPVPPLRREGPSLFGVGAGDSGDFPEDADPAASPDGRRRHGPADCPPSGAAESRIWINRLGPSSMPGARRFAEMGGTARRDGRRGRRKQRVTGLLASSTSASSAQKRNKICHVHSSDGGPERTRTSDLRFRKPLLYPAELRDHMTTRLARRAPI